jgi:hypothetical protein
MKRRPRRAATVLVVLLPMNGSSTVSPIREAARMQGVMRASGKTAKWLPVKGLLEIVQTSRLLRVAVRRGMRRRDA